MTPPACGFYPSRRDILARLSSGFGLAALGGLMAQEAHASQIVERARKIAPKARSVIFCYMSGGVSHIDSFDPKPLLARYAGKPPPFATARTQFNNDGVIQPSHWNYQNHGQSGLPVSDLFPHMATLADDIAVVRSMTAKFSEHAQGNFFMHTGFPFVGYPSAGAWTSYGLGSESRDLPGYVVLQSATAKPPHGGVGLFGSGFLPAQHQASIINVDAPEPVPNIIARDEGGLQRRRLNFIEAMDQRFMGRMGPHGQIEAAIQNYEMAWRMQAAVPELCDISGETPATKRLYGMDGPVSPRTAYGHQCLLARRLVEKGVRFIELSCLPQTLDGGQAANPWDQHGAIKKGHANMAHQVDQPIAGLVKDLKSRGLLDSTLVIWAGEFGRTPFAQGTDGRDHNPFGFTIWMAGGGIKGGTTLGSTDDFGYKAVEKPQTVFDLWATVLHLMGVDHTALTYLFSGRNVRLTDVHGHVMKDILA